MPTDCFIEHHPPTGLVACCNKAQASLRTPKRFARNRVLGRRASVWSAAACCRFVIACPTTVSSDIILRAGQVACCNKAQASLRTPKRFARDRALGRRASVWSAAACCRFVTACPTTVTSNIILRPVRLHAATKRKRACALRNASRGTGRSAGAPAFGVRRLAAAFLVGPQKTPNIQLATLNSAKPSQEVLR